MEYLGLLKIWELIQLSQVAASHAQAEDLGGGLRPWEDRLAAYFNPL